MKNRFNKLTSKEWLPFQKSWFRYESAEKLLRENIRFFTKAEDSDDIVYYSGPDYDVVSGICDAHSLKISKQTNLENTTIQFAIIDLRSTILQVSEMSEYQTFKFEFIKLCQDIFHALLHRRFLCILIPNIHVDGKYSPVSWDLAFQLSSIFSLKDEKIACITEEVNSSASNLFSTSNKVFYCLYFRKDEKSAGEYIEKEHLLFTNNAQSLTGKIFPNQVQSWFILKPAPRKKDEILHPAKYPEELVNMFISEFTHKNDNIFDPMSGTGSTQVAALKAGRNGYGTELSDFFANIAWQRCDQIVNPLQKELFKTPINNEFIILNKDARAIHQNDFPKIDYIITSPPYWDMLNMKGAENQAKRVEKGLQTNYSENLEDIGNIADYEKFMDDLINIYVNIISLLKPGCFMTIVVKNIKKKGKNYPFAWDLSSRLMEHLILLPEVFWCQDDINLAPYGFGNTFVSNTFHQYCLNFQKPKI